MTNIEVTFEFMQKMQETGMEFCRLYKESGMEWDEYLVYVKYTYWVFNFMRGKL